MILRSDLDPAALKVFDRLIGAAMAELQFEGLPAKGLAENLMSETNSENWNVAFDQIRHRFDGITERSRIAGAVRQKDPSRFAPERLLRWRRSWHHLHLEALLTEPAQDVVLHAEIVSDDRNVRWRQWLPQIARFYFGRAVHELEAGALGVLLIPDK